jgi:pimeloyl-ACP methyl ester carboxylesterase
MSLSASHSGMAETEGISLAYDTFGDGGDPPIVLVMGLGTQRVAWPDDVCQQLADAGRFVVRFDNRDVGESTHLTEFGTPSLIDVLLRRSPPYSLNDMANDIIGLLDALGLQSAHFVGASLGGFIVQTLAIRHPARVDTMTLVMTSTGSRRVGHAQPRVVARFLRRRPAASRDAAIEQTVRTYKLIGSPGYPIDESRIRRAAGISYDRAYDPAGFRRQSAAAFAQPDRTADLRQIQIPTLVIHGLDDPLVSPSGGLALARSIPRAKFVGFTGMGHDLPAPLWPMMIDEILRHTDDDDRATDVT